MALNADACRQNRHRLLLLLPPEEQEHPGLLCKFVVTAGSVSALSPTPASR